MSEKKKIKGFIGEWLEQKKTEPEFDQLVIASIEQNLSGITNESVDEVGLLKSLIELANRLGKNDRN